jgi:hypothetical protein
LYFGIGLRANLDRHNELEFFFFFFLFLLFKKFFTHRFNFRQGGDFGIDDPP